MELTGNDLLKPALIAEADDELELHGGARRTIGGRAGGGQYVIPVVFHIIHNNAPRTSPMNRRRCGPRVERRDLQQVERGTGTM